MNQFSEADVKLALEPFHSRIHSVVKRGCSEWLEIKRFMAGSGLGPILYSRTVANHVFDAVVRYAIAEFSEDNEIRIIQESQTVKFCFCEMVIVRFKKGDEDNLGQNHPTQAVLDFVSVQSALPGLPPEAAKVEILYSATDIEDGIESVIVAARDGESLLWHYELGDGEALGEVIEFPQTAPATDDDGEEIVKLRDRSDQKSDTESDTESD